MLTLLRTPRWQGFTAVVVVAIVAFGLLSRWQWDRAEQKQIEQRAQALGDTEPVSPSLTDPLEEFTPVTLTGTLVPGSALYVRQRPLEGRNGFWMMQQLRTAQGTVWLLRGWTPSGIRAGESPQLAADSLNPGPVSVTGVVRPLPDGDAIDPTDRGGLPVDQITDITSGQLPPATTAQWYVQVRSTDPPDELITVPLAENDDLQNISYAIQWLLFAAVAMGGWFFFLRREAKDSGV